MGRLIGVGIVAVIAVIILTEVIPTILAFATNLIIGAAIFFGGIMALALFAGFLLLTEYLVENRAESSRQNRLVAIAEVEATWQVADENGLYAAYRPVLSGGVQAGQYLELSAMHQMSQRTWPTSPKMVNNENYPELTQEPELAPLGPEDVPTYGQAIQMGLVSAGQVFTGWDVFTHEPVTLGGLNHIESLVFAGESTSGKSNSAKIILSQLAMMGGKILLSDRHAGHERSLAFGMGALHGCLARPIAKTPEATVELVQFAYQEFMTRVEEIDRDHRALHNFGPLILVIDEFTALMKIQGMFDALYDILNTLIIEAAKYKILVQLIGQNWSSVSTGGRADLRQSFQSRMVHKMDSEQARLMISTEASRLSEELPKGQAFLKDATGRTHYVQMPLCTEGDIELALGTGGQWSVSEPASNVPTYLPTNIPDHIPGSEENNGTLEAGNIGRNIGRNIDEQRWRRIVLALKRGDTITDITRDIYGIQASGRASAAASKEINEVIAAEVLGAVSLDEPSDLDELGLMLVGAMQDGQSINKLAETFGKRPSREYLAALDNIYATIREVIGS